MGLFDYLFRLFRPAPSVSATSREDERYSAPVDADDPLPDLAEITEDQVSRPKRHGGKPRLDPLRRDQVGRTREWSKAIDEVEVSPYRFAQVGVRSGGYLDLSTDGDEQLLARWGLPVLKLPEDLADWLEIPLGKVAWLIHRFNENHQPECQRQAHYHCRWLRKRSGGWRLIESPKRALKQAQQQILKEILAKVPPHSAAHGFVRGRSILSNAEPHVGSRVIVKFDLQNFYATVTMARVTSIFRSIGYSREAAIWLARLTTSTLPPNLASPNGNPATVIPFLRRHLPQGAPTSPALANLSAYGLDVRLSGFARSYNVRYTRYADDLTFSGPAGFLRALPTFLPLATRIIRDERFRVNLQKRKVIRNNMRQVVAGVVTNERLNISRVEFDRLKAILTNCCRHGPSTQNRGGHADFAAHLRGRIAHVQQLNPPRGDKLLALFDQIDWSR